MQKNVPVEVLTSIKEETNKLVKSQIATKALTVGAQAPDFTLPNAQGKSIELQKLLANGPVVISFYRGVWCPFCNLELKALQKALPEIKALGATLVAISPQTPDNSLSTVEKNELEFEVLSDVGNLVARKFGLVFQLTEEVLAYQKKFDVDVANYNGDQSYELPIPATYVVKDGKIAYAFIDPDFTKRLEPAEILTALK